MYRNPEPYADPTAGHAIQKPFPVHLVASRASDPAMKSRPRTTVLTEMQIRKKEKSRLDRLLLPFPFCSKAAEVTTCPYNDDEVSTARCKSCGSRLGVIYGANSARRDVEAWNRRIVR